MPQAAPDFAHPNWRCENESHYFAHQLRVVPNVPLRRQAPYQAFRILQLLFVVSSLATGIDKFFGRMTDWSQYVSTPLARIVAESTDNFVRLLGGAEIVLGIGVLLAPKHFGYLLSLWLLGNAVNLLLIPGYADVALMSFGLAVAAFCMARLASGYRNFFRSSAPKSVS